jgi:hypothetical protein
MVSIQDKRDYLKDDIINTNPIVIIYGNIIDGSNVIGPFQTWEETYNFAEKYLQANDWHATELNNPKEMVDLNDTNN